MWSINYHTNPVVNSSQQSSGARYRLFKLEPLLERSKSGKWQYNATQHEENVRIRKTGAETCHSRLLPPQYLDKENDLT